MISALLVPCSTIWATGKLYNIIYSANKNTNHFFDQNVTILNSNKKYVVNSKHFLFWIVDLCQAFTFNLWLFNTNIFGNTLV